MIYELLVFGGAVFWTLIALFVGAMLLITRGNDPDDRLAPAIILSIILAAAVAAFVDVPSVSLSSILMAVAAYVLAGLVWASTRWFLLLRRIRDFVAENGHLKRGEITTKLVYNFGSASFPPTPSAYSSRLYFWSMFWPLDAMGEAFSGPVNWIYSNFVLAFSAISRRMFQGVELPED